MSGLQGPDDRGRESPEREDRMNDQQVNALFAVYPNRAYADAAVAHLVQTETSSQPFIHGLAVVTKDLNGKVAVDEVGRPTGKRGATRGAALGAVVGIIFPPSILAASVAGAGVGGLIGHLRGHSESHRGLDAMSEGLDRGHSAVLVIVDAAATDRVTEHLVGYEKFYRVEVDPSTLAPIDTTAPSTAPE
jgi:uncharacterized membrane protein